MYKSHMQLYPNRRAELWPRTNSVPLIDGQQQDIVGRSLWRDAWRHPHGLNMSHRGKSTIPATTTSTGGTPAR